MDPVIEYQRFATQTMHRVYASRPNRRRAREESIHDMPRQALDETSQHMGAIVDIGLQVRNVRRVCQPREGTGRIDKHSQHDYHSNHYD